MIRKPSEVPPPAGVDVEDWLLMRRKAEVEYKRIAFAEEQLDDKMARALKFSDRWWHLLGQVNITRSQLITIERMVVEIDGVIESARKGGRK